MDELDLDIDNYDLTELWALFNLENGFTKTDLKSAYRIVLKTHPDKSGLPKEYFLFFSRAFKMIKKIFEYTNKEESCPGNTNEIYQSEYNENLDVSKMNSYDKKRFQSKFNELFEKVKITDDADSGYSDWLEENNSGYDTEINNKEISNTRDLHDYISNKKEEQRNTFLTTYKGIQELESNLFGGNARGSGLIREKPESYSSGLFSKLSYEDLKKAHTETLIPVTQNDFENRIRFNTVQELQTYRKQSDTLVGEKDSIHILKTMKEKEDRENVENAYKMMKQMEQIENKHNEWNSYFKQLTN